MTPEQQIIAECWEHHEDLDSDIGTKRLVEKVSAETGADADTIIGALLAKLKAGSAR